eukprot:jgi/Mesvir1/25825/Mv18182-RA.1
MSTGYPFNTAVRTPTGRSPQTQERVNDLATKIFTSYELQSLRTYMPNLQFTIEECPMITHNVLSANTSSSKTKDTLYNFIRSVYVYDILTNVMRDFHERVTNATNFNLNSMDTDLLGKIANALRGFVAADPSGKVYLGRISPEDLSKAVEKTTTSGTTATITVPSLGLVPDSEIELTIKDNDRNSLPSYNEYIKTSGSTTTKHVSDDCQPAKLIFLLSQNKVNVSEFADMHKNRILKCGTGLTGDEFENVIAPFIKRDLLAFNRMRIAILNTIASWARSEGTLQGLAGTGAAIDANVMAKYLAELGIADTRVTGIPQYSCGPGYGGVFYDGDPRDPSKKARIVDPYIVAADGTLVENPRAIFGPVCQRQRATSDLLSGITTGGGGRTSNFGSYHPGASKHVRRRKRGGNKRR